MALVVEFKPKPRESGVRDDMPTGSPFTLLFFTGVQYERMSDEQPENPSRKNKNQSHLPRRPRQRLKA